MADKRIYDIDTIATIEDIDVNTWIWMDKEAPEGEPALPSWRVRGDLFLKVLNNFATRFVPNVLTVEGKCYWHDGALYKCNVAYSGAWVPANFAATSVDELFARKDVLSALQTDVGNLQDALETTNENVTSLVTDVQNVADRVNVAEKSVNDAENAVYSYSDVAVNTTVSGYSIDPSTGLAVSNESKKIVKFAVTAGTKMKAATTGYSQFQSSAAVPSVAPANRIGDTYEGTTTVLTVPSGATFFVIACDTGETPHAYVPSSKPNANEVKIAEIRNELGTENVAITDDGYIATNGATVDITSVTSNTNYKHTVVACSEGDNFTLTGVGGSSPRLWCFIKSNGDVLANAGQSTSTTDATLTAPENSAYLVVNVDIRNDYYLFKGAFSKNVNKEVKEIASNLSVGVNLFDKNKYNVLNAIINQSTSKIASNSNARSVWIPCAPNQSYTVSKRLSERFIVGCTTSEPANGTDVSLFVNDPTKTSLTICTAFDSHYLVVFLYSSSVDTLTLDEILDTLQIQTGVIATSYQSHTTMTDNLARNGVEEIKRVSKAFNLFDKNDYKALNVTFNTATKTVTNNSNAGSIYISAEPDTYYTVKKRESSVFRVGTCQNEPANGVSLTYVVDKPGQSLAIKTGSNDSYLIVQVYSALTDTLSFEQIIDTVDIEETVDGEAIHSQPYSSMPEDVMNNMAYKPMAKPNKGYICLVSDDGKAELATYALPMIIDKGVPLTMAVMSNSEVFDNGTMQAAVLDAVENHGCSIAQHGGVRWTTYNEIRLRQFFASEKAFFDALGVKVEGAVIPEHYASTLIHAVAGGLYGIVRSGYSGYDADGVAGELHDYYDHYTSGEGSNLYGLSSFNPSNDLNESKAAIDYAYSDNKVMIVYWHENALDAAKKANIEGMIDYAKTKGLKFVTLGQLAHLIDLQRSNV